MNKPRSYPLDVANVSDMVEATPHQRSLLTTCPPLGEVLITYGEREKRHELEAIKEAIEPFINQAGFHYARRNMGRSGLFPAYDYTYGAGSIEWHEDDGYGFMAGVLLHTAPLTRQLGPDHRSSSPCALLTGKNTLPLYVGDLFIFNADRTHSWMANCKWLLACFMIRPTRKPA